jgi:spore maturation protein CgeB
MRIFLVIESSTNTVIPENQTWYRNFYETLIEMGHDVVFFPANEGRIAMNRGDIKTREIFSQKLLDSFKQEHRKSPISLFFAYLMDGMVDPSVIDEIKKCGVPLSNFSCNNVHQFYLVDELSPHFDYNLHSEKNVKEKFLKIGANPLWWPMASNPKYFKPIPVPRNIQASFVGANYSRRSWYINYLLENGIDVQVYGPGWTYKTSSGWRIFAKRILLIYNTLSAIDSRKRATASAIFADSDFKKSLSDRFPGNLHQPVSDDEQIALYSRSQISLGFLEVNENHDPSMLLSQHLHLREFEAPMCGALYLTGYFEELAEMFEPDQEVLVYHNQYELVDKARFYLKNPDKAEKIRKAGRKRALADHSYQKRFKDLFVKLGLS